MTADRLATPLSASARVARLRKKSEGQASRYTLAVNLDESVRLTPDMRAPVTVAGTGILHSYLGIAIIDNNARTFGSRMSQLDELAPAVQTHGFDLAFIASKAKLPFPPIELVQHGKRRLLRDGRRGESEDPQRRCGSQGSCWLHEIGSKTFPATAALQLQRTLKHIMAAGCGQMVHAHDE